MLQERASSSCSRRSFQHFPKIPMNWRKPHVLSAPLRHSELHPHPSQPWQWGATSWMNSARALCVFIYSGEFCSSPHRGFPNGSCLFLEQERPRQGIGMSQSCFSTSPKLIFLLPSTSQSSSSWRIIPPSTSAFILE